MKHYSLKEWSDFLDGIIDDETRTLMEEHLLECTTCSEIYLSLFDDDYANKIYNDLPDNFISNVMNTIKEHNCTIDKIKRKNSINNMLIYYVSAACLTLFLTSQGVFNFFYNNTKNSLNKTKSYSKNTAFLYSGWTDKLTYLTSSFLDNLIE